jgi:hypothetical protein
LAFALVFCLGCCCLYSSLRSSYYCCLYSSLRSSYYCSYSVCRYTPYCAHYVLAHSCCALVIGCPTCLVRVLDTLSCIRCTHSTLSCLVHYCTDRSAVLRYVLSVLVYSLRSTIYCSLHSHILCLVPRLMYMCGMNGPKGPSCVPHVRSKAPFGIKKYPAVAGYSRN